MKEIKNHLEANEAIDRGYEFHKKYILKQIEIFGVRGLAREVNIKAKNNDDKINYSTMAHAIAKDLRETIMELSNKIKKF